MTKKDYAEVLKYAIKLQIDGVNEDIIAEQNNGNSTEWLEGIVRGLEIAIEKIDASMFLAEKE